jgi:glutaredoxin
MSLASGIPSAFLLPDGVWEVVSIHEEENGGMWHGEDPVTGEPFGEVGMDYIRKCYVWFRVQLREQLGLTVVLKRITNPLEPETKEIIVSKKATFYHAGCPVGVSAEQQFVEALDRDRFEVEVVHLGQSRNRIAEAESADIRSVPALVIDSQVFNINHGADLSALK